MMHEIFSYIKCVYHFLPMPCANIKIVFITSTDKLKSCNVQSIKDDACGCILYMPKVNAECLIAVTKKKVNCWHVI